MRRQSGSGIKEGCAVIQQKDCSFSKLGEMGAMNQSYLGQRIGLDDGQNTGGLQGEEGVKDHCPRFFFVQSDDKGMAE